MASSSTGVGSSPPLYQPLNKDKREIRLLEILPNTSDGLVNCKLHTVLLTPDLYYTCLSYVWGDPNSTEEIIVDGAPRQVTVTLATALRHLKKHWTNIESKLDPDLDTSKFRLWADALCINQDDLTERLHQVSIMADIYSSAAMVLAWLSSNDTDLAKVFDVFERIVHIAERKVGPIDFTTLTETELCDLCRKVDIWDISQLWWIFPPESGLDDPPSRESEVDEPYTVLHNFRQIRFWTRVWIHQEVILAKRLYLLSPSHLMQHSSCLVALLGVDACLQHIIRSPESRGALERVVIRKLNFDFSKILRLLYVRFMFQGILGSNQEPASDMWPVDLYFSEDTEASKDVDHVYGLLAVTRSPIAPDYTKTIRQVNLEFMAWALSCWETAQNEVRETGWEAVVGGDWRLQVPSFMNNHSVGLKRLHDLPSWAPVFAKADKRKPIVRDPNEHRSAFVTVPELSNHLHMEIIGDGLRVKGVKAQSVKDVHRKIHSPKLLNTQLTQFIQSMIQQQKGTYPEGKSLLEVLCGTLLGIEHCQNYALDLGIWLKFSGQSDVFTSAELKNQSLPGYYLRSTLIKWASAGPKHNGNSLFITEDGYIGTMPDDVLPGDVVCVLACSNELAVLRAENDHYLFVGCCFMIGLMSGEVSKLLASGSAKIETIEIR